jgi:putative transposase
MTSSAKSPYAGYRFPPEIISHAVWLYFRFPLSLRMVDEILAARGIDVSHETVRQWARKFGQAFANQIRRRLPCAGDKWHLDEVCLMIRGTKHWLWRAVVLDVLVQSRRDKQAAKRLLRKLLKKQCRTPRVMITDKLASYTQAFFRSAKAVTGITPDRVTTDGHDSYPRAIRTELGKDVRHRPSAYLNNRLEQDHRGIKGRYRSMRGFKCPRSAARFCQAHDELRNFLRLRSRHHQHVPADCRRLQFLRRTVTVLAILQAA